MSTTDPRTENFPVAAEGREALEAAIRGNRPLTPTERVIASVEAYTPQEAAERTLANEMLADTRPGVRQPLLLNLGPNHPSTHGVLRLIVELDGEVVKEVTPVIGYLHTGIEKQCENKTWWQGVTLVTRMDYLAPFANIKAYTMSVERLLDMEVPARAQWIRVLLAELNRVASHLVWLGTSGLELGAMSVFFYCYRERDELLDLFEMVSGERMNHRYFQVGGCAQDLPPGFVERVRKFVDEMPRRIDEYEALLTGNPIWKDRMVGIGTLPAELNRVASHLVWLGTSGLELGAMSVFFYCYRERDELLDLFEMVSGERMNHRYFQVGGCAQDLPPGFVERVRKFVDEMPKRIDEYEALLTGNPIWKDRMVGIGTLPAEQLLALGVTGPTLRAAGVPHDLRKLAPYSGYEHFEFEVPTATEGDCYARYLVRVREMRESLRIIQQVLDGLPEGPVIADDRKVVLPPREELAYSMEALIHHFKLVSEGFMVPEGEAYVPIESPRGEMGCYVVSDGGPKPHRVHMRDPSFVNLQATAPLCKGTYLADLIAIVATLDPVMGGVDR